MKNNKKKAFANYKTCFTLTQCMMLTGGFIFTPGVYSSDCSAPATICDVERAVSEAASYFAPVPASPTLATVSIAATSVTNLVPLAGIGPVAYKYTVTNTLRAVANNFTTSFTISCTPTPIFQIYAGGTASSGSGAVAATFATTTPGTTCPFGTASCGTPAAITLTMATANTTVTATDTNYSGTTFTSSNSGWNAYVTGYYTCTYTDPNLATAATVLVPWGQGS